MDEKILAELDRLERANQLLEDECRRSGRRARRAVWIGRVAVLVALAAPIVGHIARKATASAVI